MSQHAEQLRASADQQIQELLELLRNQTPERLRQPCPGRQKLGDGTVGALIAHTAENYQHIAQFAAGAEAGLTGHVPPQGAHRMPRFLRVLGHRRPDHGSGFTAELDLERITEQLTATRDSLSQIGALKDAQLDTVPPDGSFRFCDGKRTFQDVLRALLKHQARQLDAIRLSG